MSNRKIGFDICGTLFDSNTTFDFLDFLHASGYIDSDYRRIRTLPFIVLNKLSLKVLGFDFVKFLSLRALTGISDKNLKLFSKEFYDSFLIKKHNIEVIELLNKYKNDGCLIIFVSATIDCLAQEIADRLGADSVISSKLEMINDLATGRLLIDIYGDKLRYLPGHLDFYISDNLNDVSILRNSKEYVVVTKKKNIGYWKKMMGNDFNRILV